MVRTNSFCNVYYTLDFETALCGHHVYQSEWTPELNLKLKCAMIQEVKLQNTMIMQSVFIYGLKRNSREAYWSPFNGIIKTHKTVSKCRQKQPRDSNRDWKEKKKSWAFIPANYCAMTTHKEMISILNDNLLKRKNRYQHFDMKFHPPPPPPPPLLL